jgi:hypothetical protein
MSRTRKLMLAVLSASLSTGAAQAQTKFFAREKLMGVSTSGSATTPETPTQPTIKRFGCGTSLTRNLTVTNLPSSSRLPTVDYTDSSLLTECTRIANQTQTPGVCVRDASYFNVAYFVPNGAVSYTSYQSTYFGSACTPS